MHDKKLGHKQCYSIKWKLLHMNQLHRNSMIGNHVLHILRYTLNGYIYTWIKGYKGTVNFN